MKFGILEYGNKDSNLEYFMFFNYLPIYRYIISKGQIAKKLPPPPPEYKNNPVDNKHQAVLLWIFSTVLYFSTQL